ARQHFTEVVVDRLRGTVADQDVADRARCRTTDFVRHSGGRSRRTTVVGSSRTAGLVDRTSGGLAAQGFDAVDNRLRGLLDYRITTRFFQREVVETVGVRGGRE